MMCSLWARGIDYAAVWNWKRSAHQVGFTTLALYHIAYRFLIQLALSQQCSLLNQADGAIGNYDIEDQVNFTMYVPKVDEHFIGSLAVIPLQLFGYYMNIDVNKPRNLSKNVS